MKVIYGGIQVRDDDGMLHSTIENFNCFTFTSEVDDGVGVWDFGEQEADGRWIIRTGDRTEPHFYFFPNKGMDESLTDFMGRVEAVLGYSVRLEGLYEDTNHFWNEW